MFINKIKKIIATVIVASVIPTAAFTPALVRADDTVDSAAIIAEAIAGGAHRCNVNAQDPVMCLFSLSELSILHPRKRSLSRSTVTDWKLARTDIVIREILREVLRWQTMFRLDGREASRRWLCSVQRKLHILISI